MNQLSEEEIIKIISDDIIGYQVGYEAHEEAVKGLLDLYQKEKEKNKELVQQYDKLSRHFIQNHISKDKIKAKIEELEKIQVLHSRYGEIKVLQELLEE